MYASLTTSGRGLFAGHLSRPRLHLGTRHVFLTQVRVISNVSQFAAITEGFAYLFIVVF